MTTWVALGDSVSDPRVDWDDLSYMKELRCAEHHDARYLTKNPWVRSVFCTPEPEAEARLRAEFGKPECTCPFSRLEVAL